MRKINVLHLIEDLHIGGLEELFRMIVTGLNRDKYNVHICCIEEGGETADELRKSGIKVDILGMKSYHNLFNIIKLARYIREREIDILHTHMYFANIFGRLAAFISKTPIVIWATYSSYFEFKKRNILMARFLSKFTDRIIAASNSIKEFTAKQQGIPLDKFTVIYDCASTGKFSKDINADLVKKDLDIELGNPIIGCVARLVDVKGHCYLIEAAKEVVNKYPNTKFLLVGDGPLRDSLKGQSVSLGIEKNILFAGSRRDIPEMLSIMDIFVLPSALREGCPLSILEAMAMSKPVVATRLGGIPEEIEDGRSGILVPVKDSRALAGALIRLLSDSNKAREIGRAGRKIFEEKFTEEIMLKRIESLYDEIAEKKLIKKILFVDIHGSFWGGGQLSLLSILELVDKTRFKPVLCVPYSEKEFAEKIKSLGIEVEVIPFKTVKTINIFSPISMIVRFYGLIREKKIDLVYTNALRPTFYAGIAAKISRVPLIWHARDLRANKIIDRFLSFFTSHIIAISNIVADRFNWLKQGRISVIYNGIDTEKFKPRDKNLQIMNQLNIQGDKKVVGIVGHLEPRKGQEIFIKAASEILKQASQVKFLLIGDDYTKEQARRLHLEDLAERLGIKNNVIFAGHRNDIIEVMSVVDIFVCPFKDEAFGRVVIEAMSMAKPVIAYNEGALAELIADGKTGILIEPDNQKVLVDAVLILLNNHKEAQRISQVARKCATEHYDIKNIVHKVEQVIENVLYKRECSGYRV